MPNRLAEETSPYLLQHRDNPVDWYPWGPEALERARLEDRPILLSVGYSACHWCHVMEHESFEDPETAALMNEHFVNIKVDREERPDIDSIYMNAVQQMTGRGGWPMTVFLRPDGAPFYGGTYYPPQPRHGLPSFQQILEGIASAYRERRADVDRSAEELHEALRQTMALQAPARPVEASVLDRAAEQLLARFDRRHGGLGGAPKFPQPMTLEFLLRRASAGSAPEALPLVGLTLRKMAGGGMYDHLGGGFHRYSVDDRWLVPHFEKMLYDNALLARVYLHGYQATGEAEHRRVVEEILRYVRRDMTSPEGGFYSAEDADSEGEEGRFYVWSPEEVDRLLGPEDGPLFRAYYDVTAAGNFEGTNILHTPREEREVAREAGVPLERLQAAIARGEEILLAARAERVRPGRDEKVLTSWNAMMIQSFAEAARVLARPEYEAAAARAAEFVLAKLRSEGRLLRSYKDGRARIDGFLEDHSLLVEALVSLFEATGDVRWIVEGREIAETMMARFWSDEEGLFYDTDSRSEALLVRPRDPFDNATPSGNSGAVMALLRLGRYLDEPRYTATAERVIAGMTGVAAQMPAGFGHLLCAMDFHLAAPREVVVVGQAGDPEREAMLDLLRTTYLPNVLVVTREPGNDGDAEALVPLLRGRTEVNGAAAAYVCEAFSCRRPVTDVADLRRELASDRVGGSG